MVHSLKKMRNRKGSELLKEYPLKINCCTEFESNSVVSYYSKGHHDCEQFISAIEGDYGYKGDRSKVIQCYGKLSPSPTGGMIMTYRKLECKGSFPVTFMQVY